MLRRRFLLVTSWLFLGVDGGTAIAANKKFIFKIRTKSDGIVGNILIEASDQFAAVSKLLKRYPDCKILEGKGK